MSNAIIKTKYSRKYAIGSENFTQYQLILNNGYPHTGGQTITFPKGVTILQIRKTYPQYADIAVHVMPSETLRGGQLAKCEQISEVTVQAYRLAEPIEAAVILPATAEEQAADLVDTPDQIQLIKPKA